MSAFRLYDPFDAVTHLLVGYVNAMEDDVLHVFLLLSVDEHLRHGLLHRRHHPHPVYHEMNDCCHYHHARYFYHHVDYHDDYGHDYDHLVYHHGYHDNDHYGHRVGHHGSNLSCPLSYVHVHLVSLQYHPVLYHCISVVSVYRD